MIGKGGVGREWEGRGRAGGRLVWRELGRGGLGRLVEGKWWGVREV